MGSPTASNRDRASSLHVDSYHGARFVAPPLIVTTVNHNGSIDVIERLIGVYDADGTARGEVAYFIGARLGRAHCGLCDITHGLVRERADWRDARDALPVPFVTVHRDDQPAAIRALQREAPCVVAALDDGRVIALLDRAELDACDASPARLTAALRAAVAREQLAWPS